VRRLIFWGTLLLNVVALAIAVLWIRAQPGYEPWVAAFALVTSTLSLLSTKPHWDPPSRSVNQVGNRVGGDIAGGNITKSGR
jgi:hypothetical protein